MAVTVPPAPASFTMPPEQALEFFQAKGLKPTFSYLDMAEGEHAHAFTIAKMMDVDLLADVRASLDKALAEGMPFAAWAKEITPLLQAKGWWGKQLVVDPVAGKIVEAQLGSAARLETIFRTNLQAAYAAGHWEQIQAQKDEAPYLMYDAIDDGRTRETHKAWDGTVLPVDSPWWQRHYPPCGWQCRCGCIQLSDDELEALGLEVSREPKTEYRDWENPRTGETVKVPVGVDPGFGKTPTKPAQKTAEQLLNEKVKALPQDLAASANLGVEATNKQVAQEVRQRLTKQAGAAAIAEAEAAAAADAAAVAQAEAEAEAAAAALKAEQDAAAAQLAELGKAAPATLQSKVYQQLAKAGALDGDPVKALSTLETKLGEAKAAHQKATLLGGYKSKIVAGKIPTEAQQAAFATLSEAEQEALLVEVQKAKDKAAAAAAAAEAKAAKEAAEAAAKAAAEKAAAVPDLDTWLDDAAKEMGLDDVASVAAPEGTAAAALEQPLAAKPKLASTDPLDGASWTQIGPQAGSNPGGLYQDTSTGDKWYVKFPSNPAIARNEALTAQLYELAGIEAPEVRFVDVGGKRGIASRFVEGLERSKAALVSGQLEGLAEGFATDAWVGNWDVVGLNYDNLLVKGGRAFRVDTGGGLLYRAQGSAKGAAFGDSVLELDSLRDARTNMQASEVFGGLTKEQLEDSVRRVLRVPDDEIARVVEAWGPLDALEREALKQRLIARKRDLWERFPGARPEAATPAPVASAGARVSAVEQQTIEQARLNGYSVRTDKDQIEDQNVLVAVMQEEGKGALTRANLKLLDKGDALVQASIDAAKNSVETLAQVSELDDSFLDLIKGINARAAKGGALEQKTIDRWNALRPRLDAANEKLLKVLSLPNGAIPGEQVTRAAESFAHLHTWKNKLTAALEGKAATDTAVALEGMYERGKLLDITTVVGGKSDAVIWRKEQGWSVNLARTENGKATVITETQRVPAVSVSYHAEIEGVRVTYVPFKGNDSARALQGTLQIDVTGASADASGRVFEVLEKLGLNAERAGALDRQELFVNRVARLHTVKSDRLESAYKALDRIEDQAERVKAKIAHVNELVDADITESDQWGTWEGTYQAFGHGRAHQFRPDLDDAEFNAFAREHVIYHNPTGLGLSADEDMAVKLKRIINGGGQLASLSDRVRRGIPVAGATSATSDIADGGGNFVFTRIRAVSDANRHPTPGVYWNPRQLRRTDVISYPSDKYGNTHDATQRAYRKTTISEWRTAARGETNETNFKDSLSLFDDVEKIVMPSKNDTVDFIAWLREQGYLAWPDGRALSDVIVPP